MSNALGVALRISTQIKTLAEAPRPARAIKLHGSKDAWRIRIGDYRVIYNIDDHARMVDILTVRHRKDVYRDL